VAEEVRNLAIRAADAAKNTEKLIADIIAQVDEGADIVEQTNKDFSLMSEKIIKVGTLVAEIANASNEQVEGFDQINDAMVGIDQVTQQNSSNAEQSASAAVQMHAQAESLENYVGELLALIGKGRRILEKRTGDNDDEPSRDDFGGDVLWTGKQKNSRKMLSQKTHQAADFENF
jgi:methyl-accepting chemotaxis protein